MKEHTKNMLLKQARGNVQTSNTLNDYVAPRFAIRGAAAQVIGIFIDNITRYLSKYKLGTNAQFAAIYTQYADGTDATFKINKREIEIQDNPIGDFFDAVPDVMLSISATNQSPAGLSPGMLDAGFIHDPENVDDFGEIEVIISLPKDHNEVIEFLSAKSIEIRGLLAHEMQHVIQKIVLGYELSGTTDRSTLDVHAREHFEIDARVEEAIAIMPDEIDEDEADMFKVYLEKCLDNYLSRNADCCTDLEVLKEEMMISHMSAYKKKLKDY